MQEVLLQKFHGHLKEHHPELVLQLQEEGRLRLYLLEAVLPFESFLKVLLDSGTPSAYAEDQCLQEWKQTLPTSKYHFMKELLEAEFRPEYAALQEAGVLTPELINLITYCDPVFEGLGFNEDDPYLRYHLIGTVSEYFENVREAKDV